MAGLLLKLMHGLWLSPSLDCFKKYLMLSDIHIALHYFF